MKKRFIIAATVIASSASIITIKMVARSMHEPERGVVGHIFDEIKTITRKVTGLFIKEPQQKKDMSIKAQTDRTVEKNDRLYREYPHISLEAHDAVRRTLKQMQEVTDQQEAQKLLDLINTALDNAVNSIIVSAELQQIADDIFNKHIKAKYHN